MAKKKSKNYFTQETEDAIIEYNNEPDDRKRNDIYQERIHYAFDKLAENIIHTFKFYYFDYSSIDVKNEVVSFLVVNMHKFQEGKGKAFSYFSIVAKNYLIMANNSNYKKLKTHMELDSDELRKKTYFDDIHEKTAFSYEYFVKLFVRYLGKHLPNLFKSARDKQIANAVLELFRKIDIIENFNKKSLYILIREMTGIKTQYITSVLKVMRKHYKLLWKGYIDTGQFDESLTESLFSK